MDRDQLATAADIATVLGLIVGGAGLLAVLYQLRHIRAANFISGWQAIERSLQADLPRLGRAIVGTLTDAQPGTAPRPAFPDDDGWGPTIDYLHQGYANDEWFQRLLSGGKKRRARAAMALQLQRYVAAAYDAFDLAAILAWYSRVPGLWYAVVAEWEDGIIKVWRAGAPRLRDRRAKGRRELYECFSALYSAAIIHQTRKRRWYPWGALLRKFGVTWPRWLVAKRARHHRDDALRPDRLP